MPRTVILGEEHDAALKGRLMEWLKAAGAVPLSSEWGVAGSQEVASLTVDLRGAVIRIEAETYIGLSISGPDEVVGEIARAVEGQGGHNGVA